jgi:hypothetical protein
VHARTLPRPLACALAVSLGCGRVDFGVRADGAAAAVDGDPAAGADARDTCQPPPPPPPPRSDVVMNFSQPVPLLLLNSAQADDDPSLTADRLTVWFQSNRGGRADVYTSTRPTLAADWTTPVAVAELGIAGANTPKVSPDGLRMAVAGNGPGGESDLFLSVRPDSTVAWPAPTRLADLSSTAIDTGMAEFLGGYGAVFYSDRAGGPGGGDLWIAERSGPGCAFGPPAPVAGDVNTASGEANPWISYDGLVLVWQSDRSGGVGASDLWWSTRASITTPFGPASLVPGVNADAVDDDPWLSEDLRTLVFASVRSSNLELYQATR